MVSVIVPSYNHLPFLQRRLETIYDQTYRRFEVIIIDDGSTDGSRDYLRKFEHLPHTMVVLCERNSGSAFQQWRRGIQLAKGRYIWIAESDDYAAPEFLERTVRVLDENPTVGLVYVNSILVNARGEPIGDALAWTRDLHASKWTRDYLNEGTAEIREALLHKNTIPNASAVLFRRRLADPSSFPDPEFKLCGDWLFWMRLLLRSDVGYLSAGLSYWRQGTSNARGPVPGVLEWTEGERVIAEIGGRLGLSEFDLLRYQHSFLGRCWAWMRQHADGRDSGAKPGESPTGAPGRDGGRE